MKNNHTQLKRLAAISLFLVMCLSALPMLAPSASAAKDSTLPPAGGGGTICITFDDVDTTVYDYAFPVMRDANMPATVFVTTDYIGAPISSTRTGADLDMLHEMQDAGWEIGSHAVQHKSFTTLTEEQMRYQFSESRSILEGHGFQIDTFAYPHGHYDDNTIRVGQEYYDRLRTTDELSLPASDFPLTRHHIGCYPDIMEWEVVKGYIDRAVQTDSTVIFLYHCLADGGLIIRYDGYTVDPDLTIHTLVNYLAECRAKYGTQVVTFRDLPNSAPHADTYIWDGEGDDDLASTAANWRRIAADGTETNDVLPTSGANILWDHTDKICQWDLDIQAHSWTFGRHYTGNVTQLSGHDIRIGAGGIYSDSSTRNILRGSESDQIVCGGDIMSRMLLTSGTGPFGSWVAPSDVNLVMTGDTAVISAVTILKSLTVEGTVYIIDGNLNLSEVDVSAGGQLHIWNNTVVAIAPYDDMRPGRVSGSGTLDVTLLHVDPIDIDISQMSCRIQIREVQTWDFPGGMQVTLHGMSTADVILGNDDTDRSNTIVLDDTLAVTSLYMHPNVSLIGGGQRVITAAWDSTEGTWDGDNDVVLRDGGTVKLAPGQSFNRLEIASEDGRTATWTMTATGTVSPIVTGLKSGSYLWYLDGVEQGEIEADKDGTIALSYVCLHELSVKPAPMTLAMDGLAAAVGIVAVLAVIGGLITMLGRLKF